MLPLQQPLGHEAESHTHVPLALHAWPVAHAAQLAPAVPHEELDSDAYGSQVPVLPPLQHPLGHVAASHLQEPFVVSQRLFAQAVQAAPPVPHSELDSDAYGVHVLPLQQPLGHEAASQTHVPLALHAWPVAQAPQEAPPVPQDPLDCEP